MFKVFFFPLDKITINSIKIFSKKSYFNNENALKLIRTKYELSAVYYKYKTYIVKVAITLKWFQQLGNKSKF